MKPATGLGAHGIIGETLSECYHYAVLQTQANGRMFWFMRKKFFGSYFVLSSWRRR